MRTKSKWATNGAAAGALMLALAAPVFGQSRGDWNRNDSRNDNNTRNEQRSNYNNNYRENERVTLSGTVSSFTHERDGYRVRLDRGGEFFVPESRFGGRARDLRAGISISLGGIFRGGTVYVDAVTWPDNRGYDRGNYGYNDNYLRGTVERIDYRTYTVWVRSDNGRTIAAEMPERGRFNRANVRDLRRGDRIELSGNWVRGGVFDVSRVESVRNRRY